MISAIYQTRLIGEQLPLQRALAAGDRSLNLLTVGNVYIVKSASMIAEFMQPAIPQ